MIVRRRAMVVVALSVMIFTATASVLIGLREAPAAFAASEGYVISSAGAPTIFSSRVDMDMVGMLEGMENITGASPEVFAFSTWGGRSFVVRGVEWDRVVDVGPALVLTPPLVGDRLSAGCALLGSRLADRLGMETPFVAMLTGSYAPKVELVSVLGTFSSGSPLDDEMLVSSEVARHLSGMAADEASVIRVSTSEPAWLESLLAPENARFAIHDISVSRSLLVPGEECQVSVGVRNWGAAPGSVTVLFADNGEAFGQVEVALNSSSGRTVSVPFSSDAMGVHEISASISGEFPVSLSASLEVVDPFLVASFPGTVLMGSPLEVVVETHTGEPAPGVAVTLSDSSPSSNETGPDGACTLLADEAGEFHLVFDASGTEFEGMAVRGSAAPVQVMDPASLPSGFLPSVTALEIVPDSIKEGDPVAVVVTVENAGSEPGTFDMEVFLDGALHSTVSQYLGPAGGAVVRIDIEDLDPGPHTVQAGDMSGTVDVSPWYADNPDLVDLVVRYGGSSTLSSAGAVPIYQAAKLSEGNVALALFALGAVAALLATLAITSVFSKEVSDSRKTLGVLRALGASREYIRSAVFKQSFATALAGSLVGIALGLAVAVALVRSDAFTVFGHVLEFGIDAGMVLLTLVGAVAISLVSALASAEVAVREVTMSSIRDLPEDDGPGEGDARSAGE